MTRPRAALVAFVWCALAGAVLTLAPLSATVSTMTTSDGTVVRSTTTRRSLVEREGAAIAAVLAVPVVVALGGWLAARRAWRPGVVVSASMLVAAVLAGTLSVGLFYLPAAIAMVVAAGSSRAARPRRTATLTG